MIKTLKPTIVLVMIVMLAVDCQKKPTGVENNDDNTTWIKTYGGNQNAASGEVLLSVDGGFFIVGGTNMEYAQEPRGSVYLIKTDATGEVVWERTYGSNRYTEGRSCVQESDGPLIIAGQTKSLGQDMDAFLIKVDQDGNEIWSRTLGDSLDERIATVRRTTDGGYMLIGNVVDPDDPIVTNPGVAGYAGFAGRSNVNLIRTDSDGNEMWSRRYEDENNIVCSSGLQTSDGGFIVVATIMYFPASDNDIYLLKVDGNGNPVWSRTWEPGMSSGYELIQTADGNYLVTGHYSPPESMSYSIQDYQFIKFDPEGNDVWCSTFGDPNRTEYAKVLAQTTDGNYIAAGGSGPILLVKIDETGQRIWENQIDTDPGSNYGFSTLIQHPDGDFVIGGYVIHNNSQNIYLIKTHADGNIGS